MRNYNYIDPQALKAFYFAAQFENFTQAAEAAHLTQSGISQHVAHLEQELGVSLFIRVGRKVTLTEAGLKLKEFAEHSLDQTENFLEKLSSITKDLAGEVRYAMPASCLMTPHFSMLLEARHKFSKINLKVHICHSEEVVERLLNGKIDFGFITRTIQHKDVAQIQFAQEEYVLVSSDKKTISGFDLKNIRQYNFINYPGMDYLFQAWMQDLSRSKKTPTFLELNIAGEVNDLEAAITMALNGVGIGVFPRHCIQKYINENKLFVYKAEKKARQLYPIYLVQLKDVVPLARVETVIREFWKMKKS